MKKYKLTKETKKVKGVTLFRIQALKDFGYIKKGELGGWIEKEINLSHYGNCWICCNACVCGNARVYGNTWIYDNALCTKEVINLLGLKFDITICDNMVFVGCKSWLIKDIYKLKYKEVKKDCSLQEFKKIKKIIKILI